MNGTAPWLERRAGDFILFALAFSGIVIGVIGVVVTSVPAAIIGFLLLMLAVSIFMIKA